VILFGVQGDLFILSFSLCLRHFDSAQVSCSLCLGHQQEAEAKNWSSLDLKTNLKWKCFYQIKGIITSYETIVNSVSIWYGQICGHEKRWRCEDESKV